MLKGGVYVQNSNESQREFHTRVLAVFSSLLSRVYPATDRLPVFLFCVPEFIKRILRRTFVSTFVLNPFAKSSSHGSLMRLQVYPFFPIKLKGVLLQDEP